VRAQHLAGGAPTSPPRNRCTFLGFGFRTSGLSIRVSGFEFNSQVSGIENSGKRIRVIRVSEFGEFGYTHRREALVLEQGGCGERDALAVDHPLNSQISGFGNSGIDIYIYIYIHIYI